jgi:hypothetical protein
MDRLLRQGDQGQDVRAVQDVLNYHIRRLELLKVDGIFGPKTDSRVREFQRINNLKVDGIVGPRTSALLFEASTIPFTLLLMPRLQLTFPGPAQQQLQPPRLIPPLQFPIPGSGNSPIVPPVPLRLFSSSQTFLPALGNPANGLQLQLKVPSRNDPLDPIVQARKNIVELLDELPINSKFKAFLIGNIPNPIKTISPPSAGFKWGLDPVFDPFDPKGFGVKGNAIFTVRVAEGTPSGAPNIVVGAWGDGKLFLNFSAQQGQSRPKVEAEGQIFLGIRGTF